ncbi:MULTISPECIES: cob(I)yrinic acid a,c-diamide adenosyltransferase [Pandoraea]|uniref:Corrinoid adenosyltransferase n=1 Tax=Pandoraea iniqua TaxID=2508288 RepID=A0A5E4TSD8_9BURK|nr:MULTISPECIES: cob(I)yrinic acid a,c-diamide adenosyltransferase [Pandoraea]VVD90860.1 cob(I)yrinic acid a,c-diamide adenosyltransferase [Pandoraea iniqua]
MTTETPQPDPNATPDGSNADEARNERHRARMVRKKALIDGKIAQAQHDCGVLVITTGNGKGKSSSGFGMVVRAMGHGMKTGVVQFIKGAIPTGEEKFLRRFPEECEFHVMGEGYTWDTQDRMRDIAKAEAAWEQARRMLADASFGLLLFDELNIALKLGYLDVNTVIADLESRPEMQHVVITGRGAPQALVDAADTVTDMTPVKHAFAQGIRAQPGVEM